MVVRRANRRIRTPRLPPSKIPDEPIPIDRASRMRMFDRLPKDIRDRLNYGAMMMREDVIAAWVHEYGAKVALALIDRQLAPYERKATDPT